MIQDDGCGQDRIKVFTGSERRLRRTVKLCFIYGQISMFKLPSCVDGFIGFIARFINR